METTKQPVTQEVAKANISIALTSANYQIQKIQDEANRLEVNEDNLQAVADFIAKTKQVDKVIADKHKAGKAPALAECNNWDAAKNDLLSLISSIRNPIANKYTLLCQNIAARQREQEKKKERDREILTTIEYNLMSFSSKIALCGTNKELLAVESLINLEKTRKDKYGEFYDEAMKRYEETLKPVIVLQKEQIKIREAILKEITEAESKNEVERIDTLKEEKVSVDANIKQNQILVQEKALNTYPVSTSQSVEVIYPTVKTRRVSWDMELVDVDAALKKAKDLLEITLDKDKAKAVLQTLKDTGALNGKDEYVLHGVRYFQKTLY